MNSGSSADQSSPSPVTVTPHTATVRGGDTVQFSAKVTGNTNQAVYWLVNGVIGGDGIGGRIDSKGLYTAPTTLPTGNTAKVEATSTVDAKLSGSMTVDLQNPVPDIKSVSPTALPVGSFSLAVGGKNFVKGSKVMFGGTALSTTFVSASQITATGTSTQSQVGPMTVKVQNPDPGVITSTSSLTVQVGAAGKVKVTVIPATAQIESSAIYQFRASVDGTSGNTSVKWYVNGVFGGNATVGTVTPQGVYSAPSKLPNPNTLTVTAISAEDTTAMSNCAVTLTNPTPVLLSVLPMAIPVGDFTIVVTGSKFVTGAVVTFGGTFLPTKFVSANEVTATGNAPTDGTVQITVINPAPGTLVSNQFALEVGNSPNTLSVSAAARFLEQSTWGVTPLSLSHVQAVGFQTFLNEQFAAPMSTYAAPGKNDDLSVVQKRFFTNALTGQDQLRQRVAFALSQITVISAVKVNDPSAFVLWQNMLQKDAFGTYSALLKDVTLSPGMGNYLDMVNNDKPNPLAGTTPNENYAREVLQLFSIGLNELNQDGTPQLDGSGVPIPTYTQDTIEGFAHVFTGWTYPTMPGATGGFNNPAYYGGPMIAFDSHHDTGSKLLLDGFTVPAGGTSSSDMDAAMQNIANHPNVGPFISKQLIQHLVTSNPTPDYIARVAAVFADNGAGGRGDLKAVVTAILMDPEARRGDDPAQVQASDGHLMEPVLFINSTLRSVNATSDGDQLSDYAANMKQEPMFSPTVFNFFHPDYMIQGTNLLGPEFEIFNTSTTIARDNFVNDMVYGSVGKNTVTNIAGYVALAPNPDQMVDAMAQVMMRGQMSDQMRSTLISTVAGISDNTRRAQAALYLIGTSSQYQVQH